MDYLGIESSQYDTGKTEYPLLSRVKLLLNKNRIKLAQYYKDYHRRLDGQHFFNKLIHGCYGYFGNTVEDTYYNLKFNYQELSQQLNLVSSSLTQESNAIFYGNDYLVGVDGLHRLYDEIIPPSFTGGRLTTLSSNRPLMMLYHDHYTLQPDLYAFTDSRSTSISLIDIPLFGAMLHQWYTINKTKELMPPISEFLTQYIYTPILDDVMDIAFFNRLKQCIKIGNDIFIDGALINTDTHQIMGGYLLSVDDLVNQLTVSIAETLSKDVYTIGEILHQIPGLVKKDMRSLYPVYDNNGLTSMEWVNALVQGWLITQSSEIVSQLDRWLPDSNVKMFRKSLTRNKRKTLSLIVPKDDRDWFINRTTL